MYAERMSAPGDAGCRVWIVRGLMGGALLAAGCSFDGNRRFGATDDGGGAAAAGGGGSAGHGGGGGSGGSPRDAGAILDAPTTGDRPPACVGLRCQQVNCPAGTSSSISGTVYIPAGNLPLYNVNVYVPNAPLAPLPAEASCNKCDSMLSGSPIVTTTTDTRGRFILKNVPVGNDIPLVMQVGKWRRKVTVPTVTACVENPITDVNQSRLPRDKSEGDIPRIALATGGADALECLLRKVGIADSEFTPDASAGRVNLFAGHGGANKYDSSLNGGADFSPATTFWSTVGSLKRYDVVLLSCEGTQDAKNKTPADLQAMQDYANLGGRVFASHWHNYWIELGPAPFPTAAVFNHQDDLPSPFTADIDTTFPKGQAIAEWLLNVGGSTTLGQLVIVAGQHTVDAVNVAQRWIYSSTPTSVQYLTFNTPMTMAPADQCGRVVLSDIHVSSGDQSSPSRRFPTGCRTTTLTPQEKALIFMLFDLSACIVPDDMCPGGQRSCTPSAGGPGVCPPRTACVGGCCVDFIP